MALSVVDLYSKILPRTNCKECGFPTCIAFAGKVVSQKYPLENCPHIPKEILEPAQKELAQQYKEGRWLQKDMAQEALEWAKQKASSMKLSDIGQRIGASLETIDDKQRLSLPYFNGHLFIYPDQVTDEQGNLLSPNEQTFVYIHMAQGGQKDPSGNMKSFKEFPNTVSKVSNMRDRVETPLKKAYELDRNLLYKKASAIGGQNISESYNSCDFAIKFVPFPKVPVIILFWNAQDEFESDVKVLFDETVIEHLDIESIMFLSEHLAGLLA